MIDYVDAGQAVPMATLSDVKGSAPPTEYVDHDRILEAASEPQN